MLRKFIYTVLGLMLFLVGIYYILESESVDYIVMSILLSSGIGFLQFPTKLVGYLQAKMSRNSKQ